MGKKKKFSPIVEGRMFIEDGEDTYEVYVYNKKEKLKKERGYIKDNYVYIYRGKYDDDDIIPGSIYKNRRGEYEFVDHDKYSKKTFSIDNIIDVDLKGMIGKVKENKENFVTKEEVDMMNTISNVFKPTIIDEGEDADDFLKYAVKLTILEKNINLNMYKDKVKNDHDLTNLKARLIKKGQKMTPPVFIDWCNLLGLQWELVISDDGTDNIRPLKEPVIVSSKNFIIK